MTPLIVADESIDFAVAVSLRDAGFTVYSILEEHPGWPDTDVLRFAFAQNAFLITEDKDFGELTFRLKKPNHGILLISCFKYTSSFPNRNRLFQV
jgi:predicted nuclease of predicted toxin-antitoxin system